eukprot:TRINITY_DN406_c0_g2_i1.p1 TRINITY_DN406_c0_g2~~TRINITY_DN406_c0_g2_i1.p1  ORF type:complete len:221 (-),score=65.70 TRINITY_DN406_c0_g2_i1:147-809(-)
MNVDKTILVTVGTTKFDKLIRIVDNPNFVSCILALGYNHLIIQYGAGSPPKHITSSLSVPTTSLHNTQNELEPSNPKETSKSDEDGSVWISRSPRIKFSAPKEKTTLPSFHCSCYAFKPSLQPDLLAADLVISHAGAGSIIETLKFRPRKNLVVVINDELMDNHQIELAQQMENKHHLFCTTPEQLIQTLQKCRFDTLVEYQSSPTSRFASLLDQHMGFS